MILNCSDQYRFYTWDVKRELQHVCFVTGDSILQSLDKCLDSGRTFLLFASRSVSSTRSMSYIEPLLYKVFCDTPIAAGNMTGKPSPCRYGSVNTFETCKSLTLSSCSLMAHVKHPAGCFPHVFCCVTAVRPVGLISAGWSSYFCPSSFSGVSCWK